MHKGLSGLSVALILLSAHACLAHGGSTTLNVSLHKQRGPTCLVAAAVTAASARGIDLDIQDFARRTPVFPNGVHPFDVAATAYEFGLSSLIFTGPPDAAAALVRAGFAPVAFVKAGKGRHALVITGVRQPKDLAQRKHAGHELRLADPALNTHTWASSKAFANRQSGQQMIVLFRERERADLGTAGFPINIAANMDAQFRAETLYRRALKHDAPNRQMKSLLQKALRWHPCHRAARALWSNHKFEPNLRVATLMQCGTTR